jgi:hypothetical protein
MLLGKREYETPIPDERVRFDAERAPFLFTELQARDAQIHVLEARLHAKENECRELRSMLFRATRARKAMEARAGAVS